MSFDALHRRLQKVERSIEAESRARVPPAWIVTQSEEDRARQLAALAEAGTYRPGGPVIEWRVVSPDPSLKEIDRELRQHRPPPTAH